MRHFVQHLISAALLEAEQKKNNSKPCLATRSGQNYLKLIFLIRFFLIPADLLIVFAQRKCLFTCFISPSVKTFPPKRQVNHTQDHPSLVG